MIELFLFLVFGFYGYHIFRLAWGIRSQKLFVLKDKVKPVNLFSIIVPFKDEQDTLPKLLASFSELDYPKEAFEVLLVDDNDHETIYQPDCNFEVKCLKNQRYTTSPKKDAIQTALKEARFRWIITTDADCEVPKKWLKVLDEFLQNHSDLQMVCGMVMPKATQNFLGRFQQADFLSLQAVTIGSFGLRKPFMCNGANFAYTQDFFKTLGGFSGNEHIASGDDVFLLQKAVTTNLDRIGYLYASDFVITTQPVSDWSALFSQRIRWGTKTKAYRSYYARSLAFSVFLANMGFVLAIILSFSNWTLWFFVIFKLLIDSILIFSIKSHSQIINKIEWVVFGCIYPLLTSIIGLRILFSNSYTWKGNQYKV